MPHLMSTVLCVASLAVPAGAQVTEPGVGLEIAAGGLWQRDIYDKSGPGVGAVAALRLGGLLAIGTDVAWFRTDKSWLRYSDHSTAIALTASLLWHFGDRPTQPYLGVGAALVRWETCTDFPSAVDPRSCSAENAVVPVFRAGVKMISNRGLLVAPEVRLDGVGLRFSVSVGRSWAKRM